MYDLTTTRVIYYIYIHSIFIYYIFGRTYISVQKYVKKYILHVTRIAIQNNIQTQCSERETHDDERTKILSIAVRFGGEGRPATSIKRFGSFFIFLPFRVITRISHTVRYYYSFYSHVICKYLCIRCV